MSVTVTENDRNAIISQAEDGILIPGQKWFSLQDNLLNGTYHPLDSSGIAQIGWWGTTLSDGSGNLASSPALTITMNRTVFTLQVAGDSILNEYPVDFTVKLYNGASLLYTETVVGNTQVVWKKALTQPYDTTKVVLTVSKLNKANRTVKIVDALSLYEIVRSDVIKVISSEGAGSVTVNLTKSDTLLTKINDAGTFPYKHFTRIDTLKPMMTEDKNITVKMIKTDNLYPVVNEGKAITVELTRVETLPIRNNVEEDEITVDFSSGDTLSVESEDSSKPTNVYTLMDASTRQVFGMIEITYTNPLLNEVITINANQTNRNTHLDEVADNITEPKYKWFALDNNVLDGSSHPMPSDREYSIGWWGTESSNNDGTFDTSPILSISFEPRAVISLKVVGDDKLNCYPVDFTISARDIDDNELYLETVTNNAEVYWYKDINTILNVVKLVLTITKINQPNACAKITEFYTAVKETYREDMIQSLHILEETGYDTGKLPIGNISSNELDLILNNQDGRFDLDNTQSSLHGLIKRNRKVKVWLGVEIVPGSIEWYPMGVYWTVSWNVPNNSFAATLVARDRLEMMRYTDFIISDIYENYNLLQLFEIVLQDAGLTVDDYVLDPDLASISIPYAWFDRMSHRNALNELSKCALVQVYCDKEGKVVVDLAMVATPTVMTSYDDDNTFNTQFPMAWSNIVNYVEVTAQPLILQDATEIYKNEETVTLGPGESITMNHNFNTIPCKNVELPVLIADAHIIVDTFAVFAWGATVVYLNTDAIPHDITKITIQGQPLKGGGKSTLTAKDDQLIFNDGMVKATHSHAFIQTSQYAQTLANNILASYKNSKYDVDLTTRGNIALRLGDNIVVRNNKIPGAQSSYMVARQTIDWNGFLSGTLEGKKQ